MMAFLEINGIETTCTDEELIALGLELVDGSISDNDF